MNVHFDDKKEGTLMGLAIYHKQFSATKNVTWVKITHKVFVKWLKLMAKVSAVPA